ncbi:DUF4330 family protein [Haloarcula salina]|uniref:DUF4330 domain-containing protein n=1 Tax=Haloarcula salina TaxID=1429914 RepID=A0AA41KB10_9EURY|nr:DUF4330 family protein [Haloarcula salina]MBV0900400.1 DUF4330 domain-containing protein [Haloarcula salina]
MNVIDENGNLFGVVNAIDALAILVVLTVLTAGATLVLSGSNDRTQTSEPEPIRYATVSYTVPLTSDAAAIDTGTMISPSGSDETFQVEDVHRSFSNSSAHIVARVSYRGTPRANGGRIYGGDTIAMVTNSYRFRTTVLSVNDTAKEIRRTTVPVVVRASVDEAVARAIRSGQQVEIQNQTVASIQSVSRRSGTGNEQVVRVEIELAARTQKQVPMFGGNQIRLGSRISIVTDNFMMRGSVISVESRASEELSDRHTAGNEERSSDNPPDTIEQQ